MYRWRPRRIRCGLRRRRRGQVRRVGPDEPGRAGGAGGAGRGNATTFAVVDLARHTATVINGSAPALSGNGRTLAYIARAGADYRLMVGPTLGAQTAVRQTP